MNKILQSMLLSILVIGLGMPLAAETVVTTLPLTVATTPLISGAFSANGINKAKFIKVRGHDDDEKSFRFTLQHHIDFGNINITLPKETVTINFATMGNNPLFFMDFFAKALAQLDMLGKPLQATTVIELLLPRNVSKDLGTLPALLLMTQINADGVGTSDVVWFSFHKDLMEGQRPIGILDLGGIKGQLVFTKNMESLKTQLHFFDNTLDINDELMLAWGDIMLNSTFNADLVPLQINLALPSHKGKIRRENVDWNLQFLNFNWDVVTKNGVELVEIDSKVGHFDIEFNDVKMSLDNLAVTSGVEEEQGFINENVQIEVGKLHLPSEITFGKELEVSYLSTLNVRHLDVTALLALQTAAPKLFKRFQALNADHYRYYDQSEKIQKEIITPLLDISLQLLAKSPEIDLTQLQIVTSEGNFQGSMNITIDGSQVTSLENPLALIPALQAKTQFSIDKTLLVPTLMMLVGGDAEQVEIINEQQISVFVEQQWLVEADNQYTFSAEFKNGQLIVNGKEISLAALLENALNSSSPRNGSDEENQPLLREKY
jgi:hypothetical protein